MPKFSAYMRGEEGPQGDVGQAVLLNGIVSSSSELPPNTQNQKNLVYYVGDEQEGYHLYVYTTTEAQWIDLGSIKGQKGDTGPAAGFAINQNYEIFAVDPDAEPQISIIPDPNSPDTAKIFNFTFGLPRGQNAGFNQNQNIEIENVDTVQEMYASVSTDENSPNTAKIFNFKFGIPRGEAADFGEPTASISTISSLSTASVSITSSGSATSKIFDFHFDIPQGQKGDRGDSFSIYEPVAFTTGSEYWVDNTTFVYPRGDNSKLPIYIYNEDTDELDNSSFTFTDTDIVYNSEQPFNGTLYLMAGANRPTINIGEVSTTSFDGQMSVSLNERSTSSDAIIDFILKPGPQGEQGESAGFGEPTVSASTIEADQPASVSISTDGSATSKIFNFHFDIPRGHTGDSLAIYEGISFSTDSSYWNGNTFIISQGSNHKIPLYIYDNDHNSLAATFNVANGIIKYEADEPFNGTIYLASQTARSTLRIGNVSSTTYGNGSYFSLNPESTSTDAVFDVILEQGPRGTTALSAQVGRVSYTSGIPNVEIEGEQDLVFNFDLPRGFKGERGDTFTVDVDEIIDVLGYDETPIVETTSTSTGIFLKFKLPPSVSAQLGDLSQLNTISVTSNYITGILPVNKGGTGVNQLTTNAILLGNNTAIKQKATSAGVFYASGNNVEPGFGILPIAYGGTGTTTFTANAILLGNGTTALKTKATANGAFFATSANAEPSFGTLPIEQGGTGATSAANAWTALGGGASGKHPDNYFALASHGTHVSYGTSVSAIGTASAGSASTVSRSDHVHNIALATGDSNGQVKIAGQNVAVKGLGSYAYKSSLAAGDITSGTFDVARIPSLDASKITSGTFSVDRIPNLGYNKISVLYDIKASLGATGTTGIYQSFARAPKSNATGNGECSFIISQLGNFGGQTQGIYVITCSDRGSVATMKVVCLIPGNDVEFGYWSDSNYFYYGIYSKYYRGTCTIMSIGGNNVVENYRSSQLTSVSGWTKVNPIALPADSIPTLAYSKISGATAIVQRPNYSYGTSKPSSLSEGQLFFVYEN